MKLKEEYKDKDVKVYVGRMRTWIPVREGYEKDLLYFGFYEFFERDREVSKTVKSKVDDTTEKEHNDNDNSNPKRKRKPSKS